MKNLLIFISVCTLTLPTALNAKGLNGTTQSEFNQQGKLAVSGNVISFNNIKQDKSEADPFTFILAPVIGYMLIDNLQVNLGIEIGSISNGADGDNETVSTLWSLTPSIRYYFEQLSDQSLFPSLGLNYTHGQNAAEVGSGDLDFSLSRLSFGAGITQALGGPQGGFLTLTLDYLVESVTFGEDDPDNIKSSGLDLSVSFGLYF